MNKAFLFVIMLVSASFVGCIEDSTDETLTEDNNVDESSNEETSQEDETITPVGVNDTTNMAPYVTAGVWNSDEDYVPSLCPTSGDGPIPIPNFPFSNPIPL